MFHVGQKVVCVEDGLLPGSHPNAKWIPGEAIVRGQRYTVSSVHKHKEHTVLWLEEVRRADVARATYGPLVGYDALRFRPVQTRPTSIEIFERIRDQVTKKENV